MSFVISYDPLWATLQSRRMKKIDLVKQGIVTPAALKKLQIGDPISLTVVGKICVGLEVTPNDVVGFKALDGGVGV